MASSTIPKEWTQPTVWELDDKMIVLAKMFLHSQREGGTDITKLMDDLAAHFVETRSPRSIERIRKMLEQRFFRIASKNGPDQGNPLKKGIFNKDELKAFYAACDKLNMPHPEVSPKSRNKKARDLGSTPQTTAHFSDGPLPYSSALTDGRFLRSGASQPPPLLPRNISASFAEHPALRETSFNPTITAALFEQDNGRRLKRTSEMAFGGSELDGHGLILPNKESYLHVYRMAEKANELGEANKRLEEESRKEHDRIKELQIEIEAVNSAKEAAEGEAQLKTDAFEEDSLKYRERISELEIKLGNAEPEKEAAGGEAQLHNDATRQESGNYLSRITELETELEKAKSERRAFESELKAPLSIASLHEESLKLKAKRERVKNESARLAEQFDKIKLAEKRMEANQIREQQKTMQQEEICRKWSDSILPIEFRRKDHEFPSHLDIFDMPNTWGGLHTLVSEAFSPGDLLRTDDRYPQEAQSNNIMIDDHEAAKATYMFVVASVADALIDLVFKKAKIWPDFDKHRSRPLDKILENFGLCEGGLDFVRTTEQAAFKQLVLTKTFVEEQLPRRAKKLCASLIDKVGHYFRSVEDPVGLAVLEEKFTLLMTRALRVRVELMVSDKSYEIVQFLPGATFKPETMEMEGSGSLDFPSRTSAKIKYPTFPALYQFDPAPLEDLEAARMRSITFFPEVSAERKNLELLHKARVVVE